MFTAKQSLVAASVSSGGQFGYLVIDFFFSEFQACVSFQECFRFTDVSKFVYMTCFLILLYSLFEVCVILVYNHGLCPFFFFSTSELEALSISLILAKSHLLLFHWFTPCFCPPCHRSPSLPWLFPCFCFLWVQLALLPASSDGRCLLFSSPEAAGLPWPGSGKGSCPARSSRSPVPLALGRAGEWAWSLLSLGLPVMLNGHDTPCEAFQNLWKR